MSAPTSMWHRSRAASRSTAETLRKLGELTVFIGVALGSCGYMFRHYRTEMVRVIAAMGLGLGTLAVVGGTVVIVGFLTMSTGSFIAVQGYNSLADVGVEAFTGFLSAFLNVRIIVPATITAGLAATIGAGATAQLGAMRINEEIDALEVMGIRPVAYLATTRILAGVVVVVPLFSVAMIMSFFAARFGTIYLYGQSPGIYDHYFESFLRPSDLAYSFISSVIMAAVVMIIHTYYGYNASGGPAGVGGAVGRAVRASTVSTAMVVLGVGMAVYGQSANFNLAG